ncbi:hypothetical protein ACQKKK_15245 [Peribacillus sp. NPDC006672]|uniref:hypothetical protein n=1 Tax=Peribacillus sp. NPDC006672 TaxID=3390606 RepID=UPI003D01E0B9
MKYSLKWGLLHSLYSMVRPKYQVLIGSGSGNETYGGQIITILAAGDIITLRNIDGGTVLKNMVSGSGPLVVSASIVIEKLA